MSEAKPTFTHYQPIVVDEGGLIEIDGPWRPLREDNVLVIDADEDAMGWGPATHVATVEYREWPQDPGVGHWVAQGLIEPYMRGRAFVY